MKKIVILTSFLVVLGSEVAISDPEPRDNNIFDASLVEFTLDDEKYVDDIPFDTEEVYWNVKLEEEFDLEEEEYIDDIPHSIVKPF